MTPNEETQYEAQIPGFVNLSPEQKRNIVMRLRMRTAASNPQNQEVEEKSPTGSILPTAAAVGINQAITPSTSFAASGSLSASGAVPAVGQTGTATATAAPGAFQSIMSGTPALAAVSAVGANQFMQNGGKEVLSGKANAGNNTDAFLQTNPVTASINPILNKITGKSVGGLLSGGKSKDQQGRDQNRKILEQFGLYDANKNLTLLDGTKVNLGLDGSKGQYNVDFNEKGIGDIVALVNPLAFLIAQGDQKRANDLAGELTNAIKKSKDPKAEALNLYKKLNLTLDQAQGAFGELKNVPDQDKAIFLNTLKTLGVQQSAPQAGQQPTGSGGINIVIQGPTQATQPKFTRTDPAASVRSNLLNKMLAETQQPIQYPTQAQTGTGQPLDTTLNKIIGG